MAMATAFDHPNIAVTGHVADSRGLLTVPVPRCDECDLPAPVTPFGLVDARACPICGYVACGPCYPFGSGWSANWHCVAGIGS